MVTRLTYFYAAVVIAALTTIPTAPAGEEAISNHLRAKGAEPFKENRFGLVDIDLGYKLLHRFTRHVIAENTDKDFSRIVPLDKLHSRNPTGVQKMVACTEPRPQVCTQDYRPVCAMLQDGTFRTYSNGCNACSDPAVTGYREGACEQTDDT